jgi:hypothetical protein
MRVQRSGSCRLPGLHRLPRAGGVDLGRSVPPDSARPVPSALTRHRDRCISGTPPVTSFDGRHDVDLIERHADDGFEQAKRPESTIRMPRSGR